MFVFWECREAAQNIAQQEDSALVLVLGIALVILIALMAWAIIHITRKRKR